MKRLSALLCILIVSTGYAYCSQRETVRELESAIERSDKDTVERLLASYSFQSLPQEQKKILLAHLHSKATFKYHDVYLNEYGIRPSVFQDHYPKRYDTVGHPHAQIHPSWYGVPVIAAQGAICYCMLDEKCCCKSNMKNSCTSSASQEVDIKKTTVATVTNHRSEKWSDLKIGLVTMAAIIGVICVVALLVNNTSSGTTRSSSSKVQDALSIVKLLQKEMQKNT